MGRFIYVLPHIIGVYVVLLALIGSTLIASILITGLAALLFAYRLPQVDETVAEEVLNGGSNGMPIAHRGAALDAPENTLAAIKEAKRNGAGAVEFDLEWTVDGVAVLLHDDTVERTTDGSGTICLMTYESTQQLDASAKHSKRDQYRGEKIPTLEQTVQLCLSLGLRMYVDVKSNAEKTADIISDMCQKYPKMYDLTIVCSFDPRIVYVMRKKEPNLVTGMTFRRWYISQESRFGGRRYGTAWKHYLCTALDVFLEWATFGWLWYLIGNSAFLYIKDSVSRDQLGYFKDRNMHLVLWTVNDPVEKKYFGECLKLPYMTDSLLENTEL